MTTQNLINRALGLLPWSVRVQIKRIPGVAQLQQAVVSKAFDGKEFDHMVDAGPAKGITFHVRLPEDKGIWTGTYESLFAGRVAGAIRPNTVTYDIGSWHGFFAGVMAAQGARQVHVFEPLPANVDRIRKMIALNPEKHIAIHPCAAGDRDTEMDLIVMPETSMAKLEESGFQTERTSAGSLRVPARSIDSVIASGEAEPPSLMKIDVEGAELLVLEGARQTLRANQPEIFAEVHSSKLLAQCTIFLQSEGYSVEPLDEDQDVARANDVFQIRAVVA